MYLARKIVYFSGSGLPYRKPDAYDLFELEKYDHSAYNSVLYLLALKAMKEMAQIRKDTGTVNDVERALERAQKLFEVEMWDQRKGKTRKLFCLSYFFKVKIFNFTIMEKFHSIQIFSLKPFNNPPGNNCRVYTSTKNCI